MPRRWSFLLALALSAVAPMLVLVVEIAVLNPRLAVRNVAVVGADLWLVFLLLLVPPIAIMAALMRAVGRRQDAADVYRFTAVWLFALLWLARLEPAHQPISIRPHLSEWGLIELIAIVAWSAAALWLSRRSRASVAARWSAIAAALVAGSLFLMALAYLAEPPRRRDDAMAVLAARFPPHQQQAAANSRVLVIGIDGLEWRTVAWMVAHGRMPTVSRLLGAGRFYQHDNGALTYSAEIWTAMWTGRPTRENNVGDFAKWQFLGASQPVAFLPRFGMHGLWFIDEVLRRTDHSPLWQDEPTSTADILTPPVWAIASSAGKRVGVFDPVPQAVVPEEVNGFFGTAGDEEVQFTSKRDGAVRTDHITADPRAATDEFGGETEIVQLVAQRFSREPVDLGIYYTHFLDSIQHTSWAYRLGRSYFGGDPMTGLDDRFDATPIRRAYDEVDVLVRQLVTGFGEPATVVLLSDHGWRYDDYEHFRSPFGVLLVSPAAEAGYGGVAQVSSIAPTILALLDVPLDPTMSAPVAPFAGRRTAELYTGTVRRQFVARASEDTTRRERLRSLGYIEGRPTSVRPPSP